MIALATLAPNATATSVTLGPSDLSSTPDGYGCGIPCNFTLLQATTPEAGTLLAVPTDGTITSWLVRAEGESSSTFALRVMRPAAGGAFTGAGTSAAAASLDGATPNGVSMPILAGDHIGIDLNTHSGSFALVNQRIIAGAVEDSWDPILPDMSTLAPTAQETGYVPEFNATVLLTTPTVGGLGPSTGTTAGGDQVTIAGDHLAGTTAVAFGSVRAASFTVASDNIITATTPPESAGPVDVIVTTPAGASAITAADHYTFVAPAASSPTGTSPTGTSPTVTSPIVGGATQSHSTWREGNGLATYAKKKAPIGTIFSFTLNEPSRVSFAFTQKVGGRKLNGKCVAQSNKNRHGPTCKRTVTQGTLSFAGHSGLNKVTFQGRISASKTLKLGRYALVITATNATGQHSSPQSLSFTIVK
jgi:hypothetical protein